MENDMATFVLTLDWTDQGIRNLREAPKRSEAANLVLALGDEASYAVVLIDVTPHPANNPIMIIVRDKISAPKTMRSQQA